MSMILTHNREELVVRVMEHIINAIQVDHRDRELKLPSEHTLARELSVPRFVVRKAFERLQSLGHVYGKQGIGHFAMHKKISIELHLNSNQGFSSKVKAQGWNVRSEILSLSLQMASSTVAARLKLPEGEPVYRLKRARIVEEHVAAIHTSSLSQRKFPQLENYGPIDSLFAALKTYGITSLKSGEFLLSISLPDDEDAREFHCPKLIPLLHLQGVNCDALSHEPIEYYEVKYRADMFTYRIS